MYRRKTALNILLALAVTGLAGFAFAADTVDVLPARITKRPILPRRPRIQIALLLDTSGSMRGLIDQAKTQLWRIVNEFITVRHHGIRPSLQVALIRYGSSAEPANQGYIRLVLPLTDDLDKVSEELFALTIGGSKEYCGQVIQLAAQNLQWSPDNNDLKLIVIAGNEEFTQGTVDYKVACRQAIAKGVVVNTIYCGPYQEGVNTQWKDGAMLADGSYMSIDQNKRLVHIDAPQDKEIARLNRDLNATYVPYGAAGNAGLARQDEQDANAQNLSGSVLAQRAVSKASSYYTNAQWDLCDAVEQGRVALKDVKKDDLPENMRNMSLKARQVYIKSQLTKRAEIQTKIKEINEARKKYVAAKMNELSAKGEDTLDAAMIKSIRAQATKKNFKFEK